MNERAVSLINYGKSLLGLEQTSSSEWEKYENSQNLSASSKPVSILSLVHLQDKPQSQKLLLSPQPLSLQTILPQNAEEGVQSGDIVNLFANELWQAEKKFSKDPLNLFHVFYHLFWKYAWALPAKNGTEGVSLFEQWKAVCALVFASGENWRSSPDQKFTLVGGDFPGIQEFVYSISSKGAARALRGRSFFLQILGDAVIQRVLRNLNLTLANVIYAAGGNFMVLAPSLDARVQDETVSDKLARIKADIEKALLDEFRGDLAISLAWVEAPLDSLRTHSFSEDISRKLMDLIAEGKRSRFRNLSENEWESVFAPQGKPGNRYCVICQTPLGQGEGKQLENDGGTICPACAGFEELARVLGKAKYLSLTSKKTSRGQQWQESLYKVGETWFSFDKPGEIIYTLNNTNFLHKNAHGFRFLANVTPRVLQKDIEEWEKGQKDEPKPEIDDIRTLSQIAGDAKGMKGIGVLRMDVDNLGQVIVRGITPRTMAVTSALSSAISLFFSGYLNIICETVQEECRECLYVIYSGGDDLFILGAWHLMPLLAEKILSEFQRYTGNNPSLTISGAVTLEGAKFPIYQAAEHAGDAEEKAKNYSHSQRGVDKNAFHFLGMEVGWEEWPLVVQCRDDIQIALANGAPKALLQLLQNLYFQYNARREKTNNEVGPWIWRGAYALKRLAGGISKENQNGREAVERLANFCLDPRHIRFAGLAARWMEYLTREEK